jgi:hypothetical protein
LNETWLNPELIQKYPLGSEEREKLIKVLIATIERIEDIALREGVEKIHFLKMYN